MDVWGVGRYHYSTEKMCYINEILAFNYTRPRIKYITKQSTIGWTDVPEYTRRYVILQ